jgi:hypothetical protein
MATVQKGLAPAQSSQSDTDRRQDTTTTAPPTRLNTEHERNVQG